MSAKSANEKITFVRFDLGRAPYSQVTLSFDSEADGELLKLWKSAAFELQVGIHELLGHGSGKLFYQDGADGFNFDRSGLKHPLHDGQGISTWYKPGETWDGVFGSLSSAYEECRAECTGVFLCDDPLALSIFGHEGEEGRTITYASYHFLEMAPHSYSFVDVCRYVNWLSMARAGLCAAAHRVSVPPVILAACAVSSSTHLARDGDRHTCKGAGQF